MSKRPKFDDTFISGIHAVLNGADPVTTAAAIKQHNATQHNDSATLSLLSQIDEANAAQPTAEKENTMSPTTKAAVSAPAAAPAVKAAKAAPTPKAAKTQLPAPPAEVNVDLSKPAAKTKAAKTPPPVKTPAALEPVKTPTVAELLALATARPALIACATDMNTVMGLKPLIKTTLADQAIGRDIMKNAADINFSDYSNDDPAQQLSETTKATLSALGFVAPVNPEAAPAVKPAKKVKSTTELKAAKAAKVERVVVDTYPRYAAITDVLLKCGKKGLTFKDIQEKSDALHVAKGGESNMKTGNLTRSILYALIAFKQVTVEVGADKKKVYHLAAK
jgi:hypothetical protein